MPVNQLIQLDVTGFKSIQELYEFRPSLLNIMIGPNGAGKSNFIGFFRFMSWMLSGNLQRHIGELGYANDILYDGADVTRELTAHIQLSTQQGINEYKFRLVFAAGDTLIFVDEQYRFSNAQYSTHGQWQNLGAGYSEARILDRMADDQTARTIVNLLRRLQVYQFHNTSDTSPMRTRWSASDSRFLKENGANLSAFLYKLQQEKSAYYLKIVRQVRLILPFFDDFDLYAEKNKVLLRWREKGTIKVFNAAQASDGMLRAIALIALLSQPIVNLPDVLFLDEPELGLHPFAIT